MNRTTDLFIARQPVLDKQQRVFGYELLFRDSVASFLDRDAPEQSSSRAQALIHDSLAFDLEDLTDYKWAFFKTTPELLLSDSISKLPAATTVLEIITRVEPSPELLSACRQLKNAGYMLAVDSFDLSPSSKPLLELADILKVDFRLTDHLTQRDLAANFTKLGVEMLAANVETGKVFNLALDMGYTYFQGHFFTHPEGARGKKIPKRKLEYLEMLTDLYKLDFDLERIKQTFQSDEELPFRLLRHLNSGPHCLQDSTPSQNQTQVKPGEQEYKKCFSVLALSAMCYDKPSELLLSALFRARFLETSSKEMRMADWSQDLFLTGLFSVLDAIVDRSPGEALAKIGLNPEIKLAITEQGGSLQSSLRLCQAYEQGSWQRVSKLAAELNMTETRMPSLYRQAIEWSKQALRVVL